MTQNPLVSAIIPTCKRPDLVVRAIRSVANQTWRNHEIIVVDDSPDDATKKALATIDVPIVYLRTAGCRGAPHARNLGIEAARGEVVCFLDDDDEWLPEKTEVQLSLLAESSLVGCSCVTVGGKRPGALTFPTRVTWDEMLAYNFLGSCSFVMVDRRALGECRFDETLKACQDWQMWLSVMKADGKRDIRSSPRRLVRFNVGDHPRISNTTRNVQAVMELYQRFRAEYGPATVRALALYNLLPIEGSAFAFLLKEWTKCRLKGRSLIFLGRILLEKARGNTVIF